jgi:ABC-2 type transport system ATP-binding protein
MDERLIAVRAERLRLSSGGRTIYPAMTFQAPAGSLVALLGASGTGKTSLLLTLAGRMRGWHGTATVCGVDVARHSPRVRGLVGLGLMAGVNDLAEALTVSQHVTEQHVFVPRSKRSDRTDVLARVGLDGAANMQVKRLDAEQRVRLGLALAIVRDVRVLMVDDLDRDLNHEERSRILSLLRDLADDGLTVLASCVDDATAACADLIVPVEYPGLELQEVRADAVA